MTMRNVITVIGVFMFSVSSVLAEPAETQTKITIPSLGKSAAPITFSSDSKIVKESLRKGKLKKSVKPEAYKKQKLVDASEKGARKNLPISVEKKSSEPEIIQLEVPEASTKVVNIGNSFILKDITLRGEKTVDSVDGLAIRKQIIESLRQASVGR